MERLTKRIGNTVDFSNEKVSEFLTDHKAGVRALFEKLAYYEDLEEQGLLKIIPCKVGDIVYSVEFRDRGEIVEEVVTSFRIMENSIWIYGGYHKFIGVLGGSVFGTMEEAKAKLKEIS